MPVKYQNKVGLTVSARMGSSRLPGKALLPLFGQPMLAYLLTELKQSKWANDLILATTEGSDDDVLEQLAQSLDVRVFRGSEKDVAGRLLSLAQRYECDYLVRVTGDCPLVKASLVDYVIQLGLERACDLLTTKGSFPVGLDCEMFKVSSLQAAYGQPNFKQAYQEHVTLCFYEQAADYKIESVPVMPGLERLKQSFTVDTQADYEAIQSLCAQIEPSFDYTELESVAL